MTSPAISRSRSPEPALRPAPANPPTVKNAPEDTTTKVAQYVLGFLAFAGLAACAFALAGKLPAMGSIISPTTLLVGVTAGSITFSMLCLMGLFYLKQNKEVEVQIKEVKVMESNPAAKAEVAHLQNVINDLHANHVFHDEENKPMTTQTIKDNFLVRGSDGEFMTKAQIEKLIASQASPQSSAAVELQSPGPASPLDAVVSESSDSPFQSLH